MLLGRLGVPQWGVATGAKGSRHVPLEPSSFGTAVPVRAFGITMCGTAVPVSAFRATLFETPVPVSAFRVKLFETSVPVWKCCACQRISRHTVWTSFARQGIWHHYVSNCCACQRISRHMNTCACQRISRHTI